VPGLCLALAALAWWIARSVPETTTSGSLVFWAPAAVAMATVALIPVGLQRDPTSGLISLSRTPLMHGTHDGPRTFGGYAHLLGHLRQGTPRPEYIAFNRAVAAWIERAPADAVVVLVDPRMDPSWTGQGVLLNAWTWGWPALYLESAAWSLETHSFLHELTLVAPDGRRASIAAVARPPDSRPDRSCVIVIGPADERVSPERELARLARQVATAGCSG
jgi:hypothetical protein